MADPDDGWRTLDGDVTGWSATPSLRESVELARVVLEQAPDAALDLRATGVLVRTSAALPVLVDPAGLQRLGVVLEAADPAAAAGFWGPVLGRADLVDPFRREPSFQVVPSGEHRPLRQRAHLDVVRPAGVVEQLGLGEAGGPYGVRHADPEGNEVDVVPGGPLGEGAEDWQAVFSAMAVYRTPEPARLAAAVAELVGDLPLGIDLRPGLVVLDSGKDQWEDGVVAPAADVLAVASRIQAAARDLGAVADPAAPVFVQLFLDAADVPAVQAFWAAALGYVADPRPGLTEIHDPRRVGPVVVFQPLDPAEGDRRRQRNRTSFVLTVPADAVEERLATAEVAGGRLLGGGRVADPEGNELVIRAG
ncbi:VOC family protein [Klenkia taihuensis]|uniref:Glyoxalase-like domain-containing protein n=1 Tax=Klenkia taihuensis TaxID=1225127 RepID=A0A1I1HX92_9ACTN|nr:VOC family protein [Klenkia taihuensis]SFC28496.1 hypothetical protein SAMN05661030_0569 [Klenkia taihuensis]